MTRLDFIPSPTVRIATALRLDLDQTVIGGIYMPSGAEPRARVWKLNADLSNGGELEFPNSGGKDDSITLMIDRHGNVIVTLSDAGASGASGSASKPEMHTIANVFPPAPVTTAVDQAARDQANYATSLATTAKARSDAAVTQANAATNMAHQAIDQNAVQDQQIAALQAADG